MVNYQLGKIYKIEAEGLTYIGSTTTKQLCSRMSGHGRQYRYYKKTGKSFCKSFELLDKEDCKITLVENFPCNSKDELLARERYWIDNTICINKLKPNRTEGEKQDYHKEYYIKHKEHLISKSSERYKRIKELQQAI